MNGRCKMAFLVIFMSLLMSLPVNSDKGNRTTGVINIHWEGPFSLSEAVSSLSNDKIDYGIYQIYGRHPVYGNEVLLYIGKASERTFSVRLGEHKDSWLGHNGRTKQTKVYVGRLYGTETPSDDVLPQLVMEKTSVNLTQ